MNGANEVAPRLWMGSAPPPGLRGFDTLVLAAREYQPPSSMFPGVTVVRVPMDDAEPAPASDIIRAFHVAVELSRQLRRGKKILVTCAMGRNRSGLITALTLVVHYGLSADNAIAQVRMARGMTALTNRAFVNAIRWTGAVTEASPA